MTPDDPIALLQAIWAAATSGQWTLVAGLATMLLVWAARSPKSPVRLVTLIPWLATEPGGVVLTFAVAFLGGVGTMLATGGVWSTGILSASLGVAWVASGGYTAVKKLGLPMLRWLRVKIFGPPKDAVPVDATNPPGR